MTRPTRVRRRPGRGRRVARYIGLVLAAGALAWVGGFVWYVGLIPDQPERDPAITDAIVVLTGGSQRVAAGLALLRAGQAKRLFVTGVHPRARLADILAAVDGGGEDVACCVELGHAALDTPGNALETARWMKNQGFASLRLVTGNYHMPRSVAEFRSVMPNIAIIPHPVFPEGFRLDQWWRHPATAGLIASEFDKYLWGRLSRLFARPAP